jgi:acetyl esterase/lipase
MAMSDPRLSPLYGEFSTKAPVKIHTGTLDPLEGQCKLFKETFPHAQIEVQVQGGLWHGVEDYDCPEARSSTQSMGEFFRRFST